MTGKINNISVIGGGAWGTAQAAVFADAGRNVTLYARDANLAEEINSTRENKRYLPDVRLPENLTATGDRAAAVRKADLVLLVAPAQFTRETLRLFKPHLPAGVPLISGSKGIEIATGALLSQVAAEEAPDHPYAVLSGPAFAHEVARGLPCAVTLASTHSNAESWAEALRGKSFRPYLSDDPVGAEIAGALKNVIAIACGIAAGKKLGQNAAAAVMTRGMAEIRRFGLHFGAKAETFLGLSGLGDLTLTCHSMASRNFSLGAELGEGKTLEDIMGARRTVAEGVATAKAVAASAQKNNIDMPICLGVNAILDGKMDVDGLAKNLLSRAIRYETE